MAVTSEVPAAASVAPAAAPTPGTVPDLEEMRQGCAWRRSSAARGTLELCSTPSNCVPHPQTLFAQPMVAVPTMQGEHVGRPTV